MAETSIFSNGGTGTSDFLRLKNQTKTDSILVE